MIRVCDSIMGSGKSESAIRYLNEHPGGKFIYITPYLEEAARIKKGCPALDFVEPKNLRQYGNRKLLHTEELIREGRNIATTHQSFKNYTPETLGYIRDGGYTLIIDENVDVLESSEIHPDDLQMAVDAGYIEENDGVYTISRRDYSGNAFSDVFSLLKSRELVRVQDGDEKTLYYWALPPELLTAFKDVFVLTYLFEGQSLCYFMRIYDIPYERIGIHRTEDGGYRFGEYPGYVPDYVSSLRDKIHIMQRDSVNEVGDDYFALSMKWYKRGGERVDQLKRNVSNCFNNIWRDIPSEKRLWGSFKSVSGSIKGKGYSKSFLVFNAKAMNAYRDKDHLVYPVNIFMNVNEKKFYNAHGIEVNEDMYALSVMVQWIWRSAIRCGQEIYIYIPSKRMRTLLENWIEEISNGGNGSGE